MTPPPDPCRTAGVWGGDEAVVAPCNQACSCPLEAWDPVCSQSGITYTSPCTAGCLGSSGSGKATVGTHTHTHTHTHTCTLCVPVRPFEM